MYTLRPTRPGAAPLKLLHRAWLRSSTAPAGLWSVEGTPDGPALHLHALAPVQPLPRLRHCHVYQSDPVAHLRAAAAYLVKPSSAPDPSIYDGRLWGTYGPLSYWLLHESAAPMVRGAAAEHLLSGSPSRPSPHKPQDHRSHYSRFKLAAADPPAELSDEEYASTARRHLPNLYAIASRDLFSS